MTALEAAYAQSNPLLFRFGRRLAGFHGKRLHAFKLFLKSSHKVVSAVLEEHDEAEREEHKQDKPKKAAKQRHDIDGNLLGCRGQRG
jgi:hypothetical protein